MRDLEVESQPYFCSTTAESYESRRPHASQSCEDSTILLSPAPPLTACDEQSIHWPRWRWPVRVWLRYDCCHVPGYPLSSLCWVCWCCSAAAADYDGCGGIFVFSRRAFVLFMVVEMVAQRSTAAATRAMAVCCTGCRAISESKTTGTTAARHSAARLCCSFWLLHQLFLPLDRQQLRRLTPH